jgi:hypothetical protein
MSGSERIKGLGEHGEEAEMVVSTPVVLVASCEFLNRGDFSPQKLGGHGDGDGG